MTQLDSGGGRLSLRTAVFTSAMVRTGSSPAGEAQQRPDCLASADRSSFHANSPNAKSSYEHNRPFGMPTSLVS